MSSRRDFLKNAGAWSAGGVLSAGASGTPLFSSDRGSAENGWARGSKLGISTYSYWHFDGEPVPIKHVIDEASTIGVGGVDVLHRQMPQETTEYARELRRYAFAQGVDLICLSIHQDFVTPDEQERQHHVNHTKHTLELANQMGIPCIRVNSGRWGTIDSFDKLMEAEGKEPPLEGYSEDDAYEWCIEAFKKCVPVAKEKGVVMALENHWGLTSSAEGVLRIVEAVDSPWLQVLADTGNFPNRPYEQLEALAPHTILVSAKTYYGGGEWYSLDLDYERIADIFRDADFQGYVTLEFEGTADPAPSVRKSLTRLSEAFQV
jgi:sugar phosphate isomerase/epimerase